TPKELSVENAGSAVSLRCFSLFPRNCLKYLQCLSLNGSQLTIDDLGSLGHFAEAEGLQSLQELSLVDCEINAECIAPLASALQNNFFPSLRSLHLAYNVIANAGTTVLMHALQRATSCQLQLLDLANNRITQDG